MESPIGAATSGAYGFSMIHTRRFVMGVVFGATLALFQPALRAEQVPVRYPEGTAHGLFILRSLDNKEIGRGDLTETVDGSRIASKMALTFHDGSVYEEDTHFQQDGHFRVLDYRLTQKGPAFKQDLEMTIDSATGTVVVNSTDDSHQTRTWKEHMSIPPDLSNGIVAYLIRNISPKADNVRVSMIVATPKPRLVHLNITPADLQTFPFGGSKLQAMRYAVNVDIGGLAGPLAKITGREPPTSFIWMLSGKVPSFLMAQQAFQDGPVCRIELASPNMEHLQAGQSPGD